MANIVKIEEKLNAIDLGVISSYTKKLSDIGTFNKSMAHIYTRDFIIGYDISSVCLSRAVQCELEAKNALDVAESIAYLDRSDDYFSKKGQKPTVEGKKAFVCLDEDVQKAKDVLARSIAMTTLLKNKVSEFRSAIDSVRKLYSDSYSSPYEEN
jgi:hypothetical protein